MFVHAIKQGGNSVKGQKVLTEDFFAIQQVTCKQGKFVIERTPLGTLLTHGKFVKESSTTVSNDLGKALVENGAFPRNTHPDDSLPEGCPVDGHYATFPSAASSRPRSSIACFLMTNF
jgi:hypothetical protein